MLLFCFCSNGRKVTLLLYKSIWPTTVCICIYIYIFIYLYTHIYKLPFKMENGSPSEVPKSVYRLLNLQTEVCCLFVCFWRNKRKLSVCKWTKQTCLSMVFVMLKFNLRCTEFVQFCQGSIFWSENNINSPSPSKGVIIFPLLRHVVFSTPVVLFLP
jgi:hypothetical protein